MKFKIAVAQLKMCVDDPNESLKKVESYIQKADADIIVFPEYIISWKFEDVNYSYRKKFQKLAKKYKIDIVTGSMLTRFDDKLHNTMYYIDSDGNIKGTYSKINLWHHERPHLTSGEEVCVFDTKFGKIGIIICWDMTFPEVYRKMIRKGAVIVICSAFWTDIDAANTVLADTEEIFIDSFCVTRAIENEIIHVFCNASGVISLNNKTWTLCGRSQITVPFKGALNKIEHNEEAMFIQEVDTEILEEAEKSYRIRKDVLEYKES